MSFSHILILKPSSFGDIIHTLPALHAIRTKFPSTRISWLANSAWAPLLDGNPDINETIIFPRADFKGLSGWFRFSRWLDDFKNQISPDLILDFQGLLRTGLIARVFRGTPVFGLSDAREGARFFHSRTIKAPPSSHAVERYLALAAATGAEISAPPVFNLPEGRQPEATLPINPFVVLHPYSRGRNKSLPPESILAFCRAMNHPVVLVGNGNAQFSSTPANIINLLNTTSLPELIWLLRHAAFTVSVDSGPMHLAAAISPNILGIHTWSDPCKVGPYRPESHIWKGGQIFPALDPASSTAGNHPPTPAEAENIARWVSPRIDD